VSFFDRYRGICRARNPCLKLNVRATEVTGGVVLFSLMRGAKVTPNMDTSYYADEKESKKEKKIEFD